MMHTASLNADLRYTRVAALLHWLIALFILFNLALGWFMEGFAQPLKGIVLMLHFSGGITVLALSVLRVVWRLTHRPPAHRPPLAPLERHAAHLVHFALYAGMLLMPLSGWAILSAHPRPGSAGFAAEQAAMQASHPGARPMKHGGLVVWGVLPVPAIGPVQAVGETPAGVPAQKHLHGQLVDWHGLGGWLMIALLALHLGGALKHQFIDGMPLLRRMRLTKS